MRGERQCWCITCGACGALYDDEVWHRLALSYRIEPGEVARLVRDWPDDICIEVRRCERCGRLLPTKRRTIATTRINP
jgi:hypothetical protein